MNHNNITLDTSDIHVDVRLDHDPSVIHDLRAFPSIETRDWIRDPNKSLERQVVRGLRWLSYGAFLFKTFPDGRCWTCDEHSLEISFSLVTLTDDLKRQICCAVQNKHGITIAMHQVIDVPFSSITGRILLQDGSSLLGEVHNLYSRPYACIFKLPSLELLQLLNTKRNIAIEFTAQFHEVKVHTSDVFAKSGEGAVEELLTSVFGGKDSAMLSADELNGLTQRIHRYVTITENRDLDAEPHDFNVRNIISQLNAEKCSVALGDVTALKEMYQISDNSINILRQSSHLTRDRHSGKTMTLDDRSASAADRHEHDSKLKTSQDISASVKGSYGPGSFDGQYHKNDQYDSSSRSLSDTSRNHHNISNRSIEFAREREGYLIEDPTKHVDMYRIQRRDVSDVFKIYLSHNTKKDMFKILKFRLDTSSCSYPQVNIANPPPQLDLPWTISHPRVIHSATRAIATFIPSQSRHPWPIKYSIRARQVVIPAPDGAEIVIAPPVNITSNEFTAPPLILKGLHPGIDYNFDIIVHYSTNGQVNEEFVLPVEVGDVTRDDDFFDSIPIGGIIQYTGAQDALPANYAFCDGEHGTVDLRKRFVVGANDWEEIGSKGDGDKHKHTVHIGSFRTQTTAAGGHDHVSTNQGHYMRYIKASCGSGWSMCDVNGHNPGEARTSYVNDHVHNVSVDLGTKDTSEHQVLRPRWYALAYIQRIC